MDFDGDGGDDVASDFANGLRGGALSSGYLFAATWVFVKRATSCWRW
ncbi:hypothetical protein O3683_07175 [Neisseria flavescens]